MGVSVQVPGGIELICDAYRLDGRDEIIDVLMWWQDRCWRGIEAGADAGDPAMVLAPPEQGFYAERGRVPASVTLPASLTASFPGPGTISFHLNTTVGLFLSR